MNELFRRLFRIKSLAAEIIAASFFVNILFLASPIFVIQILSRYIGYGFDGTLYTLTAGMLIALLLGMGFSVIRTRMCAEVSREPDRQLQEAVLRSLCELKAQALGRLPESRIQEIMAAPQMVQSAYEASRIASVLDMPFFVLFVLAVFVLSPLLAVITLLAVVMQLVSGKLSMRSLSRADHAYREEMVHHRGSVVSAIHGVETVRAHGGGHFLRGLWERQVVGLAAFKEAILVRRSWSLAIAQLLSSLLKVAVYAVGAKLVIMGELSVGSLIGVSILSAKALQIATSFMQTLELMGKSDEAMDKIREFLKLPREDASGTALNRFSGKLEFRDVSMGFAGAASPLFESLNHSVLPGAVVGILGGNGAGKTTLARLLVGLVELVRGQILADGVDLRQLASEWWRGQVMYMPQEPTFLNGTIRDNITMGNPDIENDRLNEIIRLTDLRRFLDSTSKGMETVMEEGGRSLPVGIRKRLALARALAMQGRLAVFDEPTEGLDKDGCEAVSRVMAGLIRDGVTLVVVSRDPLVAKTFTTLIDLDSKPIPRIGLVQKADKVRQLETSAKA
ncbi:ATP-binding cassette domain-containing protein [Pseudodesulfovibrio cashew]|uniref:ATP-binding cassette domain-containing protein n=1 Tax=Pseudodesulfovibrio cashew TaxID=2678688 RepID=A0A6I6JTU4_9BACT|nr:ATP-binding cassette domain-containing protein [Pseudodesulfovibrio cashew]QGY41114.1 ATP-binding cassette domain-containing protein [Pseudodesulfovibrio cashew]